MEHTFNEKVRRFIEKNFPEKDGWAIRMQVDSDNNECIPDLIAQKDNKRVVIEVKSKKILTYNDIYPIAQYRSIFKAKEAWLVIPNITRVPLPVKKIAREAKIKIKRLRESV